MAIRIDTSLVEKSSYPRPQGQSHSQHHPGTLYPGHLQPSLQHLLCRRDRLTPEEGQCCLWEGRCIYCAQLVHFLSSCPAKDQAKYSSSFSRPHLRCSLQGCAIPNKQTEHNKLHRCVLYSLRSSFLLRNNIVGNRERLAVRVALD